MNSKLFVELPTFYIAYLNGNECIDDFIFRSEIEQIDDLCGFDEQKLLDVDCGKVSLVAGTLVGGSVALCGQWPYLAALTLTATVQFFCGGSLITSKHVLTAAHCIHKRDGKLKAEEITVLLEKHNLENKKETSW